MARILSWHWPDADRYPFPGTSRKRQARSAAGLRDWRQDRPFLRSLGLQTGNSPRELVRAAFYPPDFTC